MLAKDSVLDKYPDYLSSDAFSSRLHSVHGTPPAVKRWVRNNLRLSGPTAFRGLSNVTPHGPTERPQLGSLRHQPPLAAPQYPPHLVLISHTFRPHTFFALFRRSLLGFYALWCGSKILVVSTPRKSSPSSDSTRHAQSHHDAGTPAPFALPDHARTPNPRESQRAYIPEIQNNSARGCVVLDGLVPAGCPRGGRGDSHKSFRTKQKLAKAQKQNRPVPQWIRLRTGNTVRYNAKRRHWRKTRLNI
ncbi:60s ribosomal protein l39 [Purpureocillium lilacinum]|uniref:Large ribosomal subunit protein eL39 n=1 Tax=Purpureocillium lilacinum TaxID=33203 RepID=A0A2U3EJA3_PURLI|nr:60s ribosomal protein l39 [Purpureocillium lilacinum]